MVCLLLAEMVVGRSALASSPDRLTDERNGCVEHFDPQTDYFPDKATLRHATGFTIEYFKHYKVVTLHRPWPGARTTLRYWLVQCGTPAPSTPTGAHVITIPIHSLVTLSATHLPHLELLGEIDSLIGVGTPERIYSSRIRDRVAEGEITAVSHGVTVNMETLLELSPDLVMAVGYDQPRLNVHPALARMGIQFAINAAYLEASPLARSEWLKFTAAFFNKEGVAEQLFNGVAARYRGYADLTQGIPVRLRPSVLVGELNRGSWYVPGGKGYVARLIEDAGGRYLWAEDGHRASFPRDFEIVFDRGQQADYWLLSRNDWLTLADLRGADARYQALQAYKKGHVYNYNARLSEHGANDYWEQGVLEPHVLLADLIKILHPALLPQHTLKYYRQLD